MIILAIACGGFIGAIARYAAGNFIKRKLNPGFPFSTLIVNLAGAFLLGVLLGRGIEGLAYAFFGVGFLGAFTTYSTFMVEAVNLKRKVNGRNAILYLAFSYTGGLMTAFLGLIMGMSMQ
ncbi:fluoride efflux transporter FluC [Bacillus salacetis]|uniref:fluoride efflux transporter FluC n=1 Tax=Bacillus salacetis TaxID=2315464 RepID=UPI001F0BB19F|nr:CrcB family protein [Bacillus salacetis]